MLRTIFLITLLSFLVFCEIRIKKIEMRPPKINDVGLVWDVVIVNDVHKEDSSFDLEIISEKCCLFITGNKTLCEMPQMITGNFGEILSNTEKMVTIIWPTITLHDRLGFCNLTFLSRKKLNDVLKIAYIIHFDTIINPGDIRDELSGLVEKTDIKQCETIDLNCLDSCRPVNCEEKYFGQLNFFNFKTNLCEPVPKCSNIKNMIYDLTINECISAEYPFCQENLIALQQGKYDQNDWETKHNISEEFLEEETESYDSLELENKSEIISVQWEAVASSLIIIVAAISIYGLICFSLAVSIFLLRKCSNIAINCCKRKNSKHQ